MRIFILFLFILTACEQSEPPTQIKGEYILRTQEESLLDVPPPHALPLPSYPWEKRKPLGEITKEHFRCKGDSTHPYKKIEERGQFLYIRDCEGMTTHSLPVLEEREYIYPILIDLLNYIQTKTGKKVVITSGHRCTTHNRYVDPSKQNSTSKHQIGAEVSFYVEEMEQEPETVIELLLNYYAETAFYQEKSSYLTFHRYEKTDTNVSTAPWYNKEVFIKLFKEDEGRNEDNLHSFPYIAIQVRYDKERKTRVIFTWNQAHRGYYRI